MFFFPVVISEGEMIDGFAIAVECRLGSGEFENEKRLIHVNSLPGLAATSSGSNDNKTHADAKTGSNPSL